MSFIDSNPSEFALLMHNPEIPSKVIQHTILRGDIQQSSLGMTGLEIIENSILSRQRCLAIDRSDLNTSATERRDLIIHQGQQRRDDDGDTIVHDCWELEAQALAEASGGLEEDIVAFEGGGDDFSLYRS